MASSQEEGYSCMWTKTSGNQSSYSRSRRQSWYRYLSQMSQAGALVFLIGCLDSGICYQNYYQSQFNYKIKADQVTESGIKIDIDVEDFDSDRIDQLVNETEACLQTTFPDGILSDDVVHDAQCQNRSFNPVISRECFKVKVPDDWVFSCDGSTQLLPQVAPQRLCGDKGLEADPNCPCRWRAGIQDNTVIVTTPNLKLFKDPLVRIVTGCNNPWYSKPLADCMRVNDG